MEEKHHIHPEDCQCSNCHYQTPWISRVFDVLGVIFVAAGIVMLLMAIFSETTEIFSLALISVFASGFAYTAIAEVIRATSETAYNTRELLKIKVHEHNK